MGFTFAWWLVVELLGLAAFPVGFVVFRNLPDRGYAFGKALGLLLLGYVLWLLAMARLLPNSRGAAILLFALLVMGGGVLLGRQREALLAFVRERWRLLLQIEAVFLFLYLMGTFVRAHNPDIAHTEQPMDFAFLNGILRSQEFPPNDPWLSGFSISYYYFGYLQAALLTLLSGVPSRVAYNLALVLVFALAGTGAFSLAYALVQPLARQGRLLRWPTALAGLAAVLAVVGVGNLEGALEVLRAHGVGTRGFYQWTGIQGLDAPYHSTTWYPSENWWWWRATRVIGTERDGVQLDYTITEFPFFSFILGDLHPHVMALPFGLLALALAWNHLREGSRFTWRWPRERPFTFLITALSLGALGFLNSWDLPTYLTVFALAAAAQGYLPRQRWDRACLRDATGAAIVLAAAAVLLYLPFYVGLKTQASGVGLVVGVGSRPLHLFLIWGLLLFPVVSFMAIRGREALTSFDRHTALLAAVPAGLLLALWTVAFLSTKLAETGPGAGGEKLWQVLPLALLSWTAAHFLLVTLRRRSDGNGMGSELFALGLATVGLLLLLTAELFYVDDTFGGASERMNTVFKLYYQAWVLFAIAGVASLYFVLARWASTPPGWPKGVWLAALAVLLLASTTYPLAATFSRTDSFRGPATLDGLAYLVRTSPDEYAAVVWLQRNVAGDPVIVEATGPEYSPYGRVSARTGLPTILGWAGHELQWRGTARDFAGRDRVIDEIYQTQDPARLLELLRAYRVEYVYLGALERKRYGIEAEKRLSDALDVVFQQGEVTIFRVPENRTRT